MTRATRPPARHRPRHARPSLLAPGRSHAAVGGLALLIGLGIAGCAAVAAGQHAPAPRPAARPAPAAAPALVGPATEAQDGAPLALGPADMAAIRSSGPVVLAAAVAVGRSDPAPASGLAASGIPSTALSAYKQAAFREARRTPACGLSWPLLAGIGRVESNHGRFAGAILHADGRSTPRVIGIALNGHGTALIRDTDRGRLDGDTAYDRAVGPMQFIPSTWAGWGVDANGDGLRDPFNIFDAAAAAADYLCAAGRDLRTASGQVQAILSYNYSYDYVSLVMALEKIYATGVPGLTVPVLPTSADRQHGRPAHHPPLPPVDPGPPAGAPHPKPPAPPPSSSPPSSEVPSADPSSSDGSTGTSSAPPTDASTSPTDGASSSTGSPTDDPSTSTPAPGPTDGGGATSSDSPGAPSP